MSEDEADAPAGGEAAGGAAEALRVDRWLWCARFYKSRSQASEAVAGGRVHVNGARVKPSRALKIGDHVSISQRGHDVELHVRRIPARRGPATDARTCYVETPASVARAAAYQEQHRLAAMAAPRPEGRPDKKSRRELIELERKQGRE